jgi:hypothetical protein
MYPFFIGGYWNNMFLSMSGYFSTKFHGDVWEWYELSNYNMGPFNGVAHGLAVACDPANPSVCGFLGSNSYGDLPKVPNGPCSGVFGVPGVGMLGGAPFVSAPPRASQSVTPSASATPSPSASGGIFLHQPTVHAPAGSTRVPPPFNAQKVLEDAMTHPVMGSLSTEYAPAAIANMQQSLLQWQSQFKSCPGDVGFAEPPSPRLLTDGGLGVSPNTNPSSFCLADEENVCGLTQDPASQPSTIVNRTYVSNFMLTNSQYQWAMEIRKYSGSVPIAHDPITWWAGGFNEHAAFLLTDGTNVHPRYPQVVSLRQASMFPDDQYVNNGWATLWSWLSGSEEWSPWETAPLTYATRFTMSLTDILRHPSTINTFTPGAEYPPVFFGAPEHGLLYDDPSVISFNGTLFYMGMVRHFNGTDPVSFNPIAPDGNLTESWILYAAPSYYSWLIEYGPDWNSWPFDPFFLCIPPEGQPGWGRREKIPEQSCGLEKLVFDSADLRPRGMDAPHFFGDEIVNNTVVYTMDNGSVVLVSLLHRMQMIITPTDPGPAPTSIPNPYNNDDSHGSPLPVPVGPVPSLLVRPRGIYMVSLDQYLIIDSGNNRLVILTLDNTETWVITTVLEQLSDAAQIIATPTMSQFDFMITSLSGSAVSGYYSTGPFFTNPWKRHKVEQMRREGRMPPPEKLKEIIDAEIAMYGPNYRPTLEAIRPVSAKDMPQDPKVQEALRTSSTHTVSQPVVSSYIQDLVEEAAEFRRNSPPAEAPERERHFSLEPTQLTDGTEAFMQAIRKYREHPYWNEYLL